MSASSNEVANSVWEEIESSTESRRSPANPVSTLYSRLSGNRGERRSTCVFPEHYCWGSDSGKLILAHCCQCKHQLAARLSSSLGACDEVQVSDDQLALLPSKL